MSFLRTLKDTFGAADSEWFPAGEHGKEWSAQIEGISGDTVQMIGTNEKDPTDAASLTQQLGANITADGFFDPPAYVRWVKATRSAGASTLTVIFSGYSPGQAY